MLLCVDFCGGYCSLLVNYSVRLEKTGLRVNRGLSQTAKEKDIVSNTVCCRREIFESPAIF